MIRAGFFAYLDKPQAVQRSDERKNGRDYCVVNNCWKLVFVLLYFSAVRGCEAHVETFKLSSKENSTAGFCALVSFSSLSFTKFIVKVLNKPLLRATYLLPPHIPE